MDQDAAGSIGPDHVPSWADLNNIGKRCARCQAIDWEPVKTYMLVADDYNFFPKLSLYSTYPTLGQLREAAHVGCHLCTLIFTCLLTARYKTANTMFGMPMTGIPITQCNDLSDQATIKVDVQVMPHTPPVWLTVDIDHQYTDLYGWITHYIPIKSEKIQISHPIQYSSSAEEIARFWLEDCCTNHQRCMSETSMLPKRVIDVVSGPEPFLFLPQRKRDRYAALSYCFGKHPVLTTTQSTLLERQAGMPMKTLPQTVRDAVTWTQQLGLQYLWVDSLCILQENSTDWEVELSSMTDIYQDATVVIAATAASHAGSGCAPVRNKLQFAPSTPVPGIVVVANFSREEWIFTEGPLERRAWTFQEIRLARRVLRCGGEELAWQCRTSKRLERDPAESTKHPIAHPAYHIVGTGVFDGLEMLDGPLAFRVWYRMVKLYSRRNLIYPEDILPAFSGMARHFARLLLQNRATAKSQSSIVPAQNVPQDSRNPAYVCGLWADDLLHGLLWFCSDPGIPIPYRGPTWSWVAYQSAVTYSPQALEKNDFCAEVLDISVTVPGLNPYGKVSSGKITMLGLVAVMPSGAYLDEPTTFLSGFSESRVHWDLLGLPQLGCICFALQDTVCLILAPETRGYKGVYRRVGTLQSKADSTGLGSEMFGKLDWRQDVVTVV